MNISLLEPLGVPDAMIEKLSEPIKATGHTFTYYNSKTTDLDELKARSYGQDIIMIANNPYPSEVIKASDSLKMLAVAFTGIDHVGLEACKERDIVVCNCAGYSNVSVAEQAVGMAVSFKRFFNTCDSTVRQGGTSQGLAGTEIFNKTVGIIGCGRIGFMTAKLFKAFDCRVIAFDAVENDEVKKAGIEYVSLEYLLKESDIISLHCPNIPETKGMIGKAQFAMMKKSALFINCARGPIVDNKALADALNNDFIAGACIDVYDMEPPIPSNYPLLNAKNTLLTPHVAFLTQESMIRRAKIEFDNVISYLEGKPQNTCKF